MGLWLSVDGLGVTQKAYDITVLRNTIFAIFADLVLLLPIIVVPLWCSVDWTTATLAFLGLNKS